MTRTLRFAAALSSVGTLALLTGCGLQGTATSPSQLVAAVQGKAMGGHQPISGAAITLYKAGTTGYGSAPTVLGTATTDSGGNFSITRNSTTCTDPDQLYMVAQGGDPGLGSVVPTNILVEALGTCSSITSSTTVVIDEISTIAAAEALSGFATVDGSSVNIGTSSTNALGLQNAMQNALALVPMQGTAANTTTAGGNGHVPNTLINSLGNSLSACVNSAGMSTAGCTSVAIAYPNSITPANTWQIALEWALYPMLNVTNVFNNATANTNFYTPTLSAAPHDVSVAIQYSVGYETNGTTPAYEPNDVKVDASGNVWVGGMPYAALAELSPAGALLSPNGGWGTTALQGTAGAGLAIDNASPANVWLADTAGQIWKYTPSTSTTVGVAVPATITTATATAVAVSDAAYAVSIDPSNNVWFSTYASTAGTSYIGRIPVGTTTADTTYAGTSTFPTATTNYGAKYLAVDPRTSNIVAGGTGVSSYFNFASPYTGAVTVSSGTSNYRSGGTTFDSSAARIWNVIAGLSGQSGGYGGVCYGAADTSGCTTKFYFPIPTAATGGTTAQVNLYGSTIAMDGVNHGLVPAASTAGYSSLFVVDASSTAMKYLATTGSLASRGSGDGLMPVDASGTSVLATATTATSMPSVAIDQAGATWLINASSTATYPVVQVFGIAAPTNAPLAVGNFGVRP
ncbi:MAG: hypothetical protein PW792_00155 [Acidobacteriaceae bacterium]|nr:hypothetical protein [Acidobacteriaceae bacterium]